MLDEYLRQFRRRDGAKLMDSALQRHVELRELWRAHHSDSGDFHNDRVRQSNIALLGWQVLRFTWLDLVEYPQRVIAVIRSATSARKQSLTER